MHKAERQAARDPRPVILRQVLPTRFVADDGQSRSGSGTSTSGGSDANDDQGRDKMPDSSQGVRPYDQQNKPARK
jgi:hypothetical protein